MDLETVFLDESVMILHTWQQQSRILHRCHEKHLCSLIDESDIVNVVSCDDIFMLTNADSLSPFEISSLSLSLSLIVLNESGFFSVAATEDGKRC